MKKNRAFLTSMVAGLASIAALGVANADSIYVANYYGDSISVIASDGTVTGFGNSTQTDNPTGIAFDPANGYLYVANAGNGQINEFTSGGTFVSTFATGLVDPQGLDFDSAGNLYLINETPGQITKFLPNGTSSVFASSLDYPAALVFDATGNLFVTNSQNTGANAVSIITPGGFVSNLNYSGATISDPTGLVFDKTGNLFVVSFGTNSIIKVAPGGAASVFASGLSEPEGDIFDSAGNLWVAEAGNNTVAEYNTATGQIITTYSGSFDGPAGLAVLPDGGTLPIPEPSTYALVFAGLGFLYFYNRRRKLALI